MTNRYSSVVIDVDSTLCSIEGIDWLAARKSAAVSSAVAALTASAMNGEIALDSVYAKRLELVAPTRSDIGALAAEYKRTLAPDAAAAIRRMLAADIEVHLVSGGLLPAIRPVANEAGVPDERLHAVDIRFDGDGGYVSFDSASPLARQGGKRELVGGLELKRPSLMVGDGATDAEVRPVVDGFAAFTGFARRDAAVTAANHVVSSFQELLSLVIQ